MARYPWFLLTALTACHAQSTTTMADATSTSILIPISTSTPPSPPQTFEIDLIFPRANETYNYTTALPLIFALHNLSATATPFTFLWAIMSVGTWDWYHPSGVTAARGQTIFDTPDGSNSTHILVNTTNPQEWNWIPGPDHKVLALSWHLKWEGCERFSLWGERFFGIQDQTYYDAWEAPDPAALGNVTGECAQLGSVGEYGTDLCLADNELPPERGDPCKVRPDESMVSSLSSAAASLATEKAEAEAAATETTSSATLSSTNAAAAATPMPVRPVVAAAVVFGGLPWFVPGALF